jgi:hypothetical protein
MCDAGVNGDRSSIRAAQNTAGSSRSNRAVFSAKTAIDQALSEGFVVSGFLSVMGFCFSRCASTSSREAQP